MKFYNKDLEYAYDQSKELTVSTKQLAKEVLEANQAVIKGLYNAGIDGDTAIKFINDNMDFYAPYNIEAIDTLTEGLKDLWHEAIRDVVESANGLCKKAEVEA